MAMEEKKRLGKRDERRVRVFARNQKVREVRSELKRRYNFVRD